MSELGKATRIPPENFEALKHAEYVALPYPKLLATALSSRLDMHLRLERRL